MVTFLVLVSVFIKRVASDNTMGLFHCSLILLWSRNVHRGLNQSLILVLPEFHELDGNGMA